MCASNWADVRCTVQVSAAIHGQALGRTDVPTDQGGVAYRGVERMATVENHAAVAARFSRLRARDSDPMLWTCV